MGRESDRSYGGRRIFQLSFAHWQVSYLQRNQILQGFRLRPRRLDVSHSMSGTLMPIFEGFVLFFIIITFFTYFLKRI